MSRSNLPAHQVRRFTPERNSPSGRRRDAQEPVGYVGLRARRHLVAAMEQQMWFFGCDAACADGNLLVRYGFQRYRSGEHRGESSCYRFHWHLPPGASSDCCDAGDACVDLHGWCAGFHPGARCGWGGFLYVRAGNRLGWYDAPQPPAPGEYDDHPRGRRNFHLLGRRPGPGFCRVAGLFFGWVEEYEDWIERICGPDYRRRCHQRAPLPWLPPLDARGWLARYCEALTLATASPTESSSSEHHHGSSFVCNQ